MPEPADPDCQGQQPLWDPLFVSVLLAGHADIASGNFAESPIQARSAWEWFTLLGPYLAQFPLLVACIAGFAVLWRMGPRRKQVLLAPILLASEAIAGTFLERELPLFLHRRAWNTHEIGLALSLSDALQSLVVAAAVAILLLNLYRWRRSEFRDE